MAVVNPLRDKEMPGSGFAFLPGFAEPCVTRHCPIGLERIKYGAIKIWKRK
jgi:hypothetical protein